jgi:uncharacterized protein YabN with tetrapyrrole methylase and pyrophosphatase domain
MIPNPTARVLIDAIDSSLPTLNYAAATQTMAANVGFDWPEVSGVIDKVREELAEVEAELGIPNNQARLADEIGDLIYICTSLARRLNIDPDQALKAGNIKFQRRFIQMEDCLIQQGLSLQNSSLAEMDTCWDIVKQSEEQAL